MNDCLFDASVAVKLAITETDTDRALQVSADPFAQNRRLLLLDIAFAETTNAIWVYHRRSALTADDADLALTKILAIPFVVVPFQPLAKAALQIAIKYQIAIYDAAFVAAVERYDCDGIAADRPLVKSVGQDFPSIRLLSDW